jgi:hypothetical protein
VKRTGTLLLALFLGVCFASYCEATTYVSDGSAPTGSTYYVAPTGGGGSDSNPGTIDQPWATLKHATLSVHAGDTVYLRGGTYTNTATPSNPDNAIGNEGGVGACTYGMCTGTAAAPITFAAYPGETPVISHGTGTPSGIYLKYGQSYIVIDGITFDACERMISLYGTTQITIKNCTFSDYPQSWGDTGWTTNQYQMVASIVAGYNGPAGTPSTFTRIQNCTFTKVGWARPISTVRCSDGVTTAGSPIVTSATANFIAADKLQYISGPGIPAYSYIGVVNSPTSISLSSDPASNVPVNALSSNTGASLTVISNANVGGPNFGFFLSYSSQYPGPPGTTIDDTSYNLVENCTFSYPGHHLMSFEGHHNVCRNNTFVGEGWATNPYYMPPEHTLWGGRCVAINGRAAYLNLVEGNRVGYADKPCIPNGANGIEITGRWNIVRNNYIYGARESGISIISEDDTNNAISQNRGNHVYNNTIYDCGTNAYGFCAINSNPLYQGGIQFNAFGSGIYNPVGNCIKNNIIRNPSAPANQIIFQLSTARLYDQIIVGNFMDSGDPAFNNPLMGDIFNALLPDLTLANASPCKNAGVFLTTITSSAGSGTSFTVDDARYFHDDYNGLISPDTIRTSAGRSATIASINYDTNTITVSSPISWTGGDGVALDFSGNAPDQGVQQSSATPTPTATPEPTATPTPAPTPTPTPTPHQCQVPNFIGTRLNRAQSIWNNAGFTTSVITIPPRRQLITWQSLPQGFIGSCSDTTIDVQ